MMPTKSKRQRESAAAAFKARQRLREAYSETQSSESYEPVQSSPDLISATETAPTLDEAVLETSTFPLSEPGSSSSVEQSPEQESLDVLGQFVQDWVTPLIEMIKKAMFLCYTFVKEFCFYRNQSC